MKARCPYCGSVQATTPTGHLRLHGTVNARCPGSHLETTVPPSFKMTVHLFVGLDTGHVEAQGFEGRPLTGDAQANALAALEAAADQSGAAFERETVRVRSTFTSAPFVLGFAVAELARRGCTVEVVPFFEHAELPAAMRAA